MTARYPLVLNGSQVQELQNSDTLNLPSALSPTIGGTGVNNGSAYLTLAGNLTTSGAYAVTITTTGATSVTLPTSGTLATTSQATSTGKAIAMSMIFGF
jgi:hypothetical protein